MNEIRLRGFACPFDTVIDIGDGVAERISRNAFQAQCQINLPCSLKLDSHERTAPDIASTADASLVLFATDYGLAFEAKIKDDGSIAWEINARKYDKASVHYSVRDVEFDADGVECVAAAQIDHIALTAAAMYGNFTGVWFADRPLDTDRLVNMAARWAEGYDAYRAAKAGSVRNRLIASR